MATLLERTEQLIRLQGQALGVLRTLADTVKNIAGAVKNLRAGGASVPAAPKDAKGGGMFAQLKGGLGAISKTLGAAGLVVGAVVGALAAVPAAVVGIVKASTSYVRALNPYLVEELERQQANLSATIGFALVPVVKYAAAAVKEFGGIILPAMQQLRPVIETMSAAVKGAAVGAFRLLVRVLEAVIGVVSRFAGVYAQELNTFGALFEMVAALVDVFSQLNFGVDLLASAAKLSADGLKRLVLAATVAAGTLLKLFGANESLRRFRAGLERSIADRRNPRAGLVAAPNDAGVTGIEDIARKMSERAFTATAGGGPVARTDTELLEEMVKLLQPIEALTPKSMREQIREGFVEALKQVANPFAGTAVPNAIQGDGQSTRGPTSLGFGTQRPGIGRRIRNALTDPLTLINPFAGVSLSGS